MSVFETASITSAYRGPCQDRVASFEFADSLVIVVADGAGGAGFGEQASAAVVETARQQAPAATGPDAWCAVLEQADLAIATGESTGVIVELRDNRVCGASVGDSRAWIVNGRTLVDLTAQQARKPLLGSGKATPVAFSHDSLHGLLLVATDGLCNYCKRPELLRAVERTDFCALPRRLVEMVRLPSGELWDDVGIIVCRRKPRPRKAFGPIELLSKEFP